MPEFGETLVAIIVFDIIFGLPTLALYFLYLYFFPRIKFALQLFFIFLMPVKSDNEESFVYEREISS